MAESRSQRINADDGNSMKAIHDTVEELQKHALVITETMMECALSRANDPRSNSGNWLITAQSVIEFRRCLVQALDVKDSQLLQIPHVDQNVLREVVRGKKKVNTVQEYLAPPAEER